MFESTQRPKVKLKSNRKPEPEPVKAVKIEPHWPRHTAEEYRKAWAKILDKKCPEVQEMILKKVQCYELDAFVMQVIKEVEYSKIN